MVATATILTDVLYYFKNYLSSNITDPQSATRPSGEKFIMTSYPTRSTHYPLITIKDLNSLDKGALGLQSEAAAYYIDIEVRVWANNVKDRDTIAQQVYQVLKDNQIGPSGTSQANDIHDFKLLSSINVDDPSGAKSKVMTFRFLFVAT